MSFIVILISFSIVMCVLAIYKLIFYNGSKRVCQKYSCREGNFFVKGKKDYFIINKNNDIEFLVENGRIIASRDLRVNKDFIYYGGEENGLCR